MGPNWPFCGYCVISVSQLSSIVFRRSPRARTTGRIGRLSWEREQCSSAPTTDARQASTAMFAICLIRGFGAATSSADFVPVARLLSCRIRRRSSSVPFIYLDTARRENVLSRWTDSRGIFSASTEREGGGKKTGEASQEVELCYRGPMTQLTRPRLRNELVRCAFSAAQPT